MSFKMDRRLNYILLTEISTMLILGIICLLIVTALLYYKYNLKKKYAVSKRPPIHGETEKIRNSRTSVSKGKSINIQRKNVVKETPISENTSKKSKILITKKPLPKSLAGISEDAFDEIISKEAFLNFNINELWPDSIMTDIYMSELCCRRLDDYLKKENLDQAQFEANMIPEIGGILLGRYTMNAEKLYRITLEEFIPIDSVNPNLYTLEFCTDSLVKELGDAIDTHPNLSVMGWFHTHPGHGLFLSIPDLTIQMGFFKEPYQVAMEIDSLSHNLDTGFFTQKLSGKMNNSLYDKPRWYSWSSIIGAVK